MYQVAGTGIAVLSLYLISYLFSKTGIYSLQFHRKIWNILLASVFLTTAFAGLFLALQITYKWNIPNIKDILRWHVELGIGMAFTGIIHFFWHLPYYFRKKTTEGTADTREKPISLSEIHPFNYTGTNLFIIGFVSSAVQFLLIREMMNISGGYELIAGVFLGIWLILSAAGSALAGKSDFSDTGKLNLLFAVTLLLTLILLLLFSVLLLEPGETPSVLKSILFILLVLAPFCIVSGFIFIKVTSDALKTKGIKPGKSFSAETTGGITAGITISLLIAGKLGTYKLFLVIALLYSAYVLLFFLIKNNQLRLFTRIAFAITLTVVIVTEPDILFRQMLMRGIKIIENHDTPYGNLTIGEYEGERSVFYNQRLLLYNNDVMEREEDVHYAMLQRNTPKNIMLISGSLGSHLKEIFKYPVNALTYVERDPALTDTSIPDSLKDKVSIINSDAFSYIKKSVWKGDVVIMLIPPPSTLLLNRYFTREFFRQIHDRLEKDGVFICSTGPGENYLNDESLRLNSSIFNTLKSVFRNVIIVPGNKTYMLASDDVLSLKFCSLSESRGLKNLYVNSDYLSDDLTEKKADEITKSLNKNEKLNTSSLPLAYNYFQSYHLSKSSNEKYPVIILLTALFAAPLFTGRRKNALMYFSASALAGFEIIALITLQFTIGNMYQMTGIVIAGLMAGLAAGSAKDYPVFEKVTLAHRTIILAAFYILTGLIYGSILEAGSKLIAIPVIILLSFIPAFITGSIYRFLTSVKGENPATIYSSDLSGSALGFILISLFAIPYLGISSSVILLGIFVFTGFLFGIIMNKH
jgi:spermidine synthase